MSHTERLRRSPNAFRRLTGITPGAFDRLLADLTPRYEQADARRKDRPGRRRRPGAGRKHALPLSDRLPMLLMYYRTYVTHAFLGFLFGVDDSAVGRNINPLGPLLAGIFRIPERKVELQPDEIRELFSGRGRVAGRAPEKKQQAYYSGKKKRHTLKSQVVVNGQTRQVLCTHHGRGPMHDFALYQRSKVEPHESLEVLADSGYQGLAKLHAKSKTPRKKPRKAELTDEQKQSNRDRDDARVVVEHVIRRLKVFRILAERYRNRRLRFSLRFNLIAGLYNYELGLG